MKMIMMGYDDDDDLIMMMSNICVKHLRYAKQEPFLHIPPLPSTILYYHVYHSDSQFPMYTALLNKNIALYGNWPDPPP